MRINFKKSGFTLIELILVVSIFLIIGSTSAVFYSRFLNQNLSATTVDQLVGQLRKAQVYALSGKQNGNWGVRLDGDTIVLFQGNSYVSRNTAFDEKFTLGGSVTVSGFTEVVFTKVTGLPSSTPTITVSSSGTTKTITINTLGIINR